jgi:hypothetical protein
MRRSLAPSLIFLVSFAVTANAIVMRHDRDEQAYIDLAKRFPATVTFVTPKDSTPWGIGTIIAPRWVLTAGHIAEQLQPGDPAKVGGNTYEVESIVQYPNWQGVKTWEDVKRDIALVRLRSPVAGIVPVKLYTGRDELGMVLTIVGTGERGTGLTGPVAKDTTMRAATNRVHNVDGTQLVFRFDAPDDADVTALEGCAGDGDSGGPAYLERDGEIYIVGVGSAQDARPTGKKLGRYGVLEMYPRVSSFASWIRATITTPEKDSANAPR